MKQTTKNILGVGAIILLSSGVEMCIRDSGTALVLIMIILFVNLLANALRKYFEKRVKTN